VLRRRTPGRQIVSLSGDGGFTMLMGDYLSLVQLRLPVKVVVFNNDALGFTELEQKSTGFLTLGTDLQNLNFAAMGEALGIYGIRLEDPGEVDAGIAAAWAIMGRFWSMRSSTEPNWPCLPPLPWRWRRASRCTWSKR
jgi:pyruvate dehydrogenase (quinone)